MRFLTLVGDLIILNIMFILTSIPVLTIGASVAALYTMTMRLIRKEEGTSTAKGYLKAFRDNLKRGGLTGILFLAVGAALFANAVILVRGGKGYAEFMKYLFVTGAVFYAAVFSWTFALLARFENTIKNTLRNALFLAVFHPFVTLCSAVCTFFPLILLYYKTYWFLYSSALWLTVGFAALCYINSLSFVKIFRDLEENASGKA